MLLSARGPATRLILRVILRLPLTSSPPSQHQNNGAKAEGALRSHHGPPLLVEVSKSFCRVLWWDEGLDTGMATIIGEAFHARSHFLSHPGDQELALTGAGAGHGPHHHCQEVTSCGIN